MVTALAMLRIRPLCHLSKSLFATGFIAFSGVRQLPPCLIPEGQIHYESESHGQRRKRGENAPERCCVRTHLRAPREPVFRGPAVSCQYCERWGDVQAGQRDFRMGVSHLLEASGKKRRPASFETTLTGREADGRAGEGENLALTRVLRWRIPQH